MEKDSIISGINAEQENDNRKREVEECPDIKKPSDKKQKTIQGTNIAEEPVDEIEENKIDEDEIEEKNSSCPMSEKHRKAIQNFCKLNEWCIIFRPINETVSLKLSLGYEGKILSAKGKSSDLEFLKGDIPFEAALSKVRENENWQEEIVKFNEINKDTIDKDKQDIEDAEQLVQNFNKEESELFNLKFAISTTQKEIGVSNREGKFPTYYKPTNPPNEPEFYIKLEEGKFHKFTKWKEEKKHQEAEIDEATYVSGDGLKKVEILCYKKSKYDPITKECWLEDVYLTADYDQLAAGPQRHIDPIAYMINNIPIRQTQNSQTRNLIVDDKENLYQLMRPVITEDNYTSKIAKEKLDEKLKIFLEDFPKQDYLQRQNDEDLIEWQKRWKSAWEKVKGKKETEEEWKLNKDINILKKTLHLLGITTELIGLEKLELAKDTNFSTSHGTETEHYEPEPIKDDDEFLVFNPNELSLVLNQNDKELYDIKWIQKLLALTPANSKKPYTVKGMQGLLDAINSLRKKGIVLNVNPAWDIKLDLNNEENIVKIVKSDEKTITSLFNNKIKDYKKDKKPNFVIENIEKLRNKVAKYEKLFFQQDFVISDKIKQDEPKEKGKEFLNYIEEQIKFKERALRMQDVINGLKEMKNEIGVVINSEDQIIQMFNKRIEKAEQIQKATLEKNVAFKSKANYNAR
jgi:hypothetical protein